MAVASLLGIPLQFLLQFYGLSITTVSHASLMVGSMPVFLAVGATLFAHERLRPVGWIALAVSTAGAALIALSSRHSTAANGPSLAGDLLVVVSMAIALFWILINQRLIATHSPVVVTAWGTLLGWLMLFACVPPVWGLPPVHGVSLKAWAAPASTTLLWNWGMTRVPASQAGVLLNMEPLMGSLLGVLVLHEHLGPSGAVGGLMIILAAITLTMRSSQPDGSAAEVQASA